MIRPLLLDLFCCAGGAATGYSRAGFDVVGVDKDPQPHYPFTFERGDALDVLLRILQDIPQYRGRPISAIHASPPCQRYSPLAKRNKNADSWPDLVGPVRSLLKSTGLPWVIENVPTAPLRDPAMLCGTMFPGLRVIRHRGFETNFLLTSPGHTSQHPLVFTHDKRKHHYGKLNQDVSFVQVTGGGNATVANKKSAMGIDWTMTAKEVNEAIPPAYTTYVGAALIACLDVELEEAA